MTSYLKEAPKSASLEELREYFERIKETVTIGGKPPQVLLDEFARKGSVTSYARSIVESHDFTTLPEPEQIDVVRLQVRDLATPKAYPTSDEINERIDQLGLEFLPAEAALHYPLQKGHKVRPGEVLFMGMKPITDSNGGPDVFRLGRRGGGLWLDYGWGHGLKWHPRDEVVFSLRK